MSPNLAPGRLVPWSQFRSEALSVDLEDVDPVKNPKCAGVTSVEVRTRVSVSPVILVDPRVEETGTLSAVSYSPMITPIVDCQLGPTAVMRSRGRAVKSLLLSVT